MLNTLLCIFILAILFAGAYYAAHYMVQLRHNRDILADEYKRATDHITAVEDELAQVKFEREQIIRESQQPPRQRTDGWESFNARS